MELEIVLTDKDREAATEALSRGKWLSLNCIICQTLKRSGLGVTGVDNTAAYIHGGSHWQLDGAALHIAGMKPLDWDGLELPLKATLTLKNP